MGLSSQPVDPSITMHLCMTGTLDPNEVYNLTACREGRLTPYEVDLTEVALGVQMVIMLAGKRDF